jgi:hypothetical protein
VPLVCQNNNEVAHFQYWVLKKKSSKNCCDLKWLLYSFLQKRPTSKQNVKCQDLEYPMYMQLLYWILITWLYYKFYKISSTSITNTKKTFHQRTIFFYL